MGLCAALLGWLLVAFGLPAEGVDSGPSDEPLWVERVPTAVLVLMMGRLSDEPDSVVDRTQQPQARVPYAERSLEEQIAWQIMVRLYRRDRTGWLDHWLFMWRARREPASVLTDPTSVRGKVYQYVIRAWAEQGRLSFEDERWARSVVDVEWEGPVALPQMAPVSVRITSFRRLLADRPVRLRVHDGLYQVTPGLNHEFRIEPVDRRPGERWDGQVKIADFVRWPNFVSPSPSEDVRFHGVVFEGDEVAGAWWPVGEFKKSVPVRIGAHDGVEFVRDDAAIAAWVNSLRGELKWDRGPGMARAWPVGMEIKFPRGPGDGWPPGFTFGGGVYLELLWSGRTEYELLADGGPSWWGLRDGRDQHGNRIIEGRRQWVVFDGGPPEYRAALMAWPGDGERLERARLVIQPTDAGGGRMFAPYWDPDAERLWENVVRIELTDVERARLERWMTDGWE